MPVQAGLGRGVGVDGRPAEDGRHRAGRDDPARAAGQHQPRGLAGEAEAGGEVDREHALEIRVGPFGDRHAVLDAGIVDQDVEPAVAWRDVAPSPPAWRAVGDVEGHRLGGMAGGGEPRRGLGQRRGVAGVDDDVGAVRGQGLGHGEAQPARGAGHQRDAAVEAEQVGHALTPVPGRARHAPVSYEDGARCSGSGR